MREKWWENDMREPEEFDDGVIRHRHRNINAPPLDVEGPPLVYTAADRRKVVDHAREVMVQASLTALVIGIVLGFLLGWGIRGLAL